MGWIPVAGSKKWWGIAALSSVLVSAALWAVRFGVNGQTFTVTHMLRFGLLAVVVSALFASAGWLGARWVWLCANAGLLAGLAAMSFYSGNETGWEDLAGFLTFVMLTIAGLMAGMVAEAAAFVIRRTRKRS